MTLNGIVIGGLVTEDHRKDWINMSIEEMYDQICKEIKGIENYLCLISKDCNLKEKNFENRLGLNRKIVDSLPQPIEKVTYSDSKNVQYLIRGIDKFRLGQSNYFYQDDRKEVLHYCDDLDYEDDYINEICRRIDSLRYTMFENENRLSEFTKIDLDRVREIYCNDDWFHIEYLNGTFESFNTCYDNRSSNEYDSLLLGTKVKIKE